ncbi:unnamed protein product [Rodentolepis nana]|uniref:START domain-containing protein n=1 Tax=Rodentolepis nana TaxID=102285 RepID=A0A0R3TV14_RODNA|nr:unnamed protein product [Rodentolepis nana]
MFGIAAPGVLKAESVGDLGTMMEMPSRKLIGPAHLGDSAGHWKMDSVRISRPNVKKDDWRNFLSLVERVLLINETYEVKSQPDFLSFKLDAVHPVRLQECQNFIVPNANCPSRGSMHIKCRFTSRLFYAQLIQLRPLDWGKFQIKLENRERISYHYIEGYFEGAMASCCQATMKGEPLIFPYISKVSVDQVSRCTMTQDSNLRLPGSIEPNGLKNYLRGLLNSYFKIYLTEHLYEPPC